MKKQRFGIRAKFIILIVSLLLVIFSLISITLITTNSRSLRSELDTQARSFARLATKPIGDSFITYKDSGRVRISQEVQAFVDLNQNITNVYVVDTEGRIVYSLLDSERVISLTYARTFEPVFFTDASTNQLVAVAPFFEESGIHSYSVVYEFSEGFIADSVRRQVALILAFSLGALLVSVLATYTLISYFFIDPIEQVSRQALTISTGKLEQQIKTERHDEVADLAQAVNAMAESLKGDIKKLQEVDRLKTEFLMIASHNLRTPLTIINGYLDEATQSSKLVDIKDMLKQLQIGSRKLSNFAEDIITIAQIEAGQSIGNRQPVEAGAYVEAIGKEFAAQAIVKKLTFTTNKQPGTASVNINKSLVKIAIWNLLENAYKFTPEGGVVSLNISHDDAWVYIGIADNGIGISEQEIPKLFTKFHRGTAMLTYNYEGTGIGLYASKLIIKEHGGDIAVKTKLGEGSIFTTKLPLAN